MTPMQVVLDASALLAFLRQEPGADRVDGALAAAGITSVNWAEVVQKSLSAGVEVEGLRGDLHALGLSVIPFSAEDANQSAMLWRQTRHLGLSLADRACLSLALRLNLPVLTCDRAWAELVLPLEIQLLR
jgi:ribonuclease VapC